MFFSFSSFNDSKYGNEGASQFVLYPMDGQGTKKQSGEKTKVVFDSSKDHINSLGFANDGYNYEQHLLTICKSQHIIFLWLMSIFFLFSVTFKK
jgi:hypothetical protein